MMKNDLSGTIEAEAKDTLDEESAIDSNLIESAEVAPGGFTSLSLAIMSQFDGGAQILAGEAGDNESEALK